jgi:hypothetical protein
MLRTALALAFAAWLAACGSNEPAPVENQPSNEFAPERPAEMPDQPFEDMPAPVPGDPAADTPTGSEEAPAAPEPAGDESPPANEDPPADAPPAADEQDDADSEAAIPAAFHGEWNSDRSQCGSAGETRLIVSGNRLRFHESIARVRRVESVNDRTIRVTAVYRGEGDRRTETRRLRLSPNGNRLTVSAAGSTLTRFRCR